MVHFIIWQNLDPFVFHLKFRRSLMSFA
uniref:Uncharacterized protein n=1 Tax=Rhizophora mucronata TaxID=61149 RepID=A0A2P2NK62_RHIMU